MIRQEIKNLIEKAIKELQDEKYFPNFEMPKIIIEVPENKNFGDYATNVSFRIAKLTGKNLWDVTEKLTMKIVSISPSYFGNKTGLYPIQADRLSGFINISIPEPCLQEELAEILEKKDKYKEKELRKIGNNQKVNVEFISANPTGPLTLGNGRGGFCGDVLSNVLNKTGYKVTREYYINDVGEQIRKLGHSIIGDSEAVYKGKYIEELRKKIKGNDPEKVGKEAAKVILEEMIKPSVKKMEVEFDNWFFEQSLYDKKEVDKTLKFLRDKDLTRLSEGALWFKSKEFGDEKDRVLIKADGEKTYLTSDIAYLKNKFKRGFEKLIFFWGADHYGYINRIKAAAVALGYKKEQVEVIIMQLVGLLEAGKEVRMSKRSGIYVTIDELINEVGLDVARFFFLTKGPNTHLNFDLDLAKEKSEKNPVYYIQYAYARICSILNKIEKKISHGNYELLKESTELSLIKQLIRWPEVIEDTAKDYQIQRVPQYAIDLATAFHQFYRECRAISENKELTKARLSLVLATKIVLKNVLDLMGISAPEKM